MIKDASDANASTEGKLGPSVQDRRERGNHGYTGETVKTVHIRHSQLNFRSCLKPASGSLMFVTDGGGDAEGRRARLAEGPGLCGKHFPSL